MWKLKMTFSSENLNLSMNEAWKSVICSFSCITQSCLKLITVNKSEIQSHYYALGHI